MTTIATNKPETRFLGLPKNKTGLFAADTIHEVKPTRSHFINVPTLSPQFRNNASANALLASAEQNHHQLQQYRSSTNEIQHYYPLDGNAATNVDSSNDSRLTMTGIRNGFPPSAVRRQRLRIATASAQQRPRNPSAHRDTPPKSAFSQSHASARLRSEIDHINSKLKHHGEAHRNGRLQSTRDFDATPQSDYSYAASCRLSSASTAFTADRIHQRFSSAITSVAANARSALPVTNDTSTPATQVIAHITSLLPIASPAMDEVETNQQETEDDQPAYAYQIPQQANVGSESVFSNVAQVFVPSKSQSAKIYRRQNEAKSVACPFYVMYLTNLTMQQRQKTSESIMSNKENIATPSGIASTMRKVPVNSRISTAHPKSIISTRRQVNSPISINTYSTIDDEDDYMSNSTSVFNNRRSSAKVSTVENENYHMLRDLLRTTSWNHIQV